MNLEQVATIRLTVAMKMELRTGRGKKSLIHSLMPGQKNIRKTIFTCFTDN